MANRNKAKKMAIIGLSGAAILAIAIFSVYNCYFKSTVTGGVSVMGTDVGGMTKAQAALAIAQGAAFPEELCDLTITYKDGRVDLMSSDLNIMPDIEGTAEKAYMIGKSGNFFKRFWDILSSKVARRDLDYSVKADSALLEDALAPLEKLIDEPVVQAKSRVTDDEIIITPGSPGNGIDMEKLMGDIASAMYGKQGRIKLLVNKQQPSSASAERLYETYRNSVKDAEFIKQADGKIGITESVVGVDFSLKTAQRKIKEAKGGEIVIPVKVTRPRVTTEELEEKLYADVLGSYDSSYVPGNTGRNTNLELACSKMAGVEMMPGEVFSYTGTIGNGTYDEGYVDAPVYSGGEIQTGVGGGICQGSSTLYCAVLFADLEIVERVNHSMPVGYVPAGMDATIATPYIDFKFRNSTEYPIRLDVTCKNGYLSVEIMGTASDPSKKVEIYNELISTKPFGIKEVENEALAEGEEIVKQNGSDGSVVETYKTVTLNGKSETVLVSTSRYNPIPKIVEVSKKDKEKEEGEEEPEEEIAEEPADGEDGDEADTEVNSEVLSIDML